LAGRCFTTRPPSLDNILRWEECGISLLVLIEKGRGGWRERCVEWERERWEEGDRER